MRYLNRFVLLPAVAVFMLGCARSEPRMPKEWGELKTDKGNVCLTIDAIFENTPLASTEGEISDAKTLVSILFPVMKGIEVDEVSIETSDNGITFGINGKNLAAPRGEHEDGKVACTQRTWAIEVSKMSDAEGAIAVEKRVVYLNLNEKNDLIVREINARRGVGLLVVPYGDQDTTFYRFNAVDDN